MGVVTVKLTIEPEAYQQFTVVLGEDGKQATPDGALVTLPTPTVEGLVLMIRRY